MTRREAVATGDAPAAIGAYSQAILTDSHLFCSGQIGLDPVGGGLLDGVEAQAERAMQNLSAVLAAAGLSMADVVKTTVFLADMGDFGTVNAIYARYMPDPPPARSTIQVAGLPRGARVEVEAIARRA